MSRLFKLTAVILIAGIIAAPGYCGAARGGEYILIDSAKVFEKDLYLACREADVKGVVLGDLISAGQRLTLEGMVSQNLYAAAQTIIIDGEVGGDILGFAQDIIIRGKALSGFRGGGQSLQVRGLVEGDIIYGGGYLVISPGAVVRGNIYTGCGELVVDGEVSGNIKGEIGSLVVGGLVTGEVDAEVETIKFTDNGRIEGDLYYRADEPVKGDFRDRVGGDVVFEQSEKIETAFCNLGWLWKIFLLITALVTGIILALAFKTKIRETFDAVREAPWKTLLAGLIGFIAIPIAAIITIALLITIPVGLTLAGLYLIFLYLGWILGGIFLGVLILDLRNTGSPSLILSALLGIIALSIIAWLPFIGGLVCLIAFILGMGVILRGLYNLFRSKIQ